MKIETPIIAILLTGLVFLGIFTMFNDISEANSITPDYTVFETQNGTSLSELFNRVNESKAKIVDTQQEFSKEKLSVTNSLFIFLQMGYSTAKALLDTVPLLNTLLFAVSEMIGIPEYIITTITSVLLILFVVSAILLMLGRTYD
jgi:hypothetical protein